MKEIQCNIKGRVQMVMFRDFAKRAANKLKLVGFVRNLDDGGVEVIAQGDENELNELIGRLQKGSLLARVDDVHIKWREPMKNFQEFKIVY